MKSRRSLLLMALLLWLSIGQDIEEDFAEGLYESPEDEPMPESNVQSLKPNPINSEGSANPQQTPDDASQQQKESPSQTVSAAQFDLEQSLRNLFTLQKLQLYRYELIGVGAILLYIICYMRGKRANAELIDAFYQETQGVIEENFAHIGFTKTSNEEPFIGESANEVLFYASGRQNVEYLEISFNMRKRQDLITVWGFEMIWPEKDQIVIDIPVKTEIPLVFLLSYKRKMKSYIEKHIDIAMLTGSFEMKNLSNHYEILGESAETVDQVFDGNTIKKISDSQGLFIQIHYTDQKMFSQSSGHLRVILNGAYKDKSKYTMALETILKMVDRMSSMKIAQNLKAKALQSRETFNASKEKASMEAHKEELRKKKEEKLRKEEAWLRSLPPEKQKKEDEKKKRKEMNKMIKGKSLKTM